MRHSHGPFAALFCVDCWKARLRGLRYVGRGKNGQRMYAGPPVSNERMFRLTFTGDREQIEHALKRRPGDGR